MTFKFLLMVIVWSSALLLSFGLRSWGFHHPDPFIIRPFVIWTLLGGPSGLLACYLVLIGFQKLEV